MTILHAEGTDANEYGQSELDFLDDADKAACEALVAAGTVPFYNIVNPHHTSCYRGYHAAAFQKYLAAGGAGVQPTKPIPQAPLAPSAALRHARQKSSTREDPVDLRDGTSWGRSAFRRAGPSFPDMTMSLPGTIEESEST